MIFSLKNKGTYDKIVNGETMNDVLKRIYEYSLEEIMGDRFGRYSKAIIQDRALPDVRDGLKPVQRRILYAMYKDGNTYNKPYRKSAKTVGNVIGNYHPHGDTSIYEAMVRMSQWWKQGMPYIDMHGNNGSMDGDSAAAMRYTEARLAKISNEFFTDINKNTIEWTWNFDDTELEPTVLPVKFPNLLVNGSTGISAGYATNIPPHNLGEVIDATIKRIDSPNCRLDTLLDIIKGPDFPTGGIAQGKQGIIDAFTKGRGKVVLRSKVEVVTKRGKSQIVVHEIPFEVIKQNLVKKIDEIRLDKKIDGITEVRDESDRENPVSIVIDLKKDANVDLILNYLYKNTDLQVSYNYNMVAIINKRPMTVGILPILDAYIEHEKNVITKRTEFDLEHALKRMHIIEGLIKALSILDEVIKTIRASKNKADAKENLVKKYDFTMEQAEAIVVLQLYKLTNTDVTELMNEQKSLEELIAQLRKILGDENELKQVMKNELRSVKKEYATPRKTEIKDEIAEIKIDTTSMIPKEDVMVVVTHDGYVKRTSMRSYSAVSDEEPMVKEGDYVTAKYQMNTMDTLLLFTDQGNYLYIPVYELPDIKWKDLGKHVSNVIKLGVSENIIGSVPVFDFEKERYITMFTKNGMVKRTLIGDFKVQRYSKPLVAMKLKEGDTLLSITDSNYTEVFITTRRGLGLWYDVSEIPVTSTKSSGVKAIALKEDEVVSAHLFNGDADYLTVITSKNTAKRVKLSEFDKTTRARRGVQVVRDVKTNPYYILATYILSNKTLLGMRIGTDFVTHKNTDFPIMDRYSTGSVISKKKINDIYEVPTIVTKDTEEEKVVSISKEDVSLKEVDERILTIDDFLKNIESSEDD